jgi:hypothetical protein
MQQPGAATEKFTALMGVIISKHVSDIKAAMQEQALDTRIMLQQINTRLDDITRLLTVDARRRNPAADEQRPHYAGPHEPSDGGRWGAVRPSSDSTPVIIREEPPLPRDVNLFAMSNGDDLDVD